MEEGEHLEAHNLFNRLLSIDEDNEQVPLLIDQMYQNDESPPSKTPSTPYWFAFPLSLTLLLLFFVFSPQQKQSDLMTANVITKTLSSSVVRTSTVENSKTNTRAPKTAKDELVSKTVPETNTLSSATKTKTKTKTAAYQKITKTKTKTKTKTAAYQKITKTKKIAPIISKEDPKKLQPIDLPDGELTITVPNSWADVWIDGKHLGRTGGLRPIPLKPGKHEIRLENPYAKPYKKEFSINSGEKTVLEIPLQYKPATIVIPDQIDSQCIGYLDGNNIGTMQKNQYKISITNPKQTHRLQIQCSDKPVMAHNIPILDPGSTFPLNVK